MQQIETDFFNCHNSLFQVYIILSKIEIVFFSCLRLLCMTITCLPLPLSAKSSMVMNLHKTDTNDFNSNKKHTHTKQIPDYIEIKHTKNDHSNAAAAVVVFVCML